MLANPELKEKMAAFRADIQALALRDIALLPSINGAYLWDVVADKFIMTYRDYLAGGRV